MPVAHDDRPVAAARRDFVRRILHRWFVQYNPLYLLSAMLVLYGCFLWSRGLVHQEGLAGPLGIALVGELYALCLLGGAALLVRIGFARPAVMLALLFCVYQWDMTLHTETCAYLGAPGAWAAAAWLALFAAKLVGIAWALRVRFSRRFIAAALVVATGLVLGPRLVPGLGAARAGALIAAWLFAAGTLVRPLAIRSRVPLGAWGETVLSRVARAVLVLSAGLVGMHLLVWWRDHAIAMTAVLLTLPLLAIDRSRRERRAWVIAGSTVAFAALLAPSTLAVTALLAAAALASRALSANVAAPPRDAERSSSDPYRATVTARDAPPTAAEAVPVGAAERARLLSGALASFHLGAWTVGWSGAGAWPPHVLALDVALAVGAAMLAWRLRSRAPIASVIAPVAHLVWVAGIVPIPASSAAWGETVVAFGFALLGASLWGSYRLRGTVSGAPSERAIARG